MGKKYIKLPSNDGVHTLNVVAWLPDIEIKAVLQISHGMIEMIERYEDFALYLNKSGFAVYGNDHLGHGKTAGKDEDLGYFCPENMSATVIEDLHSVTKYAKKQHPNVPYFLLGHSMGSFMARRYLMTYGDELTAAIICGTGRQPKVKLTLAKLIANIQKVFTSDRHRSKLMKKLAFGHYLDKIDNPRTPSDWLTRDEKIVDFCLENKYCNFEFTINGYRTLFDVLTFIQKDENISKIPTNLPIFFIAGDADPVGEYAKGVKDVYNKYRAAGISDIDIKLYPQDRHEILNELDREIVYEDALNWLESKM